MYVQVVMGILIVMLIGSVIGIFTVPPLLKRIDRTGKVGILGF